MLFDKEGYYYSADSMSGKASSDIYTVVTKVQSGNQGLLHAASAVLRTITLTECQSSNGTNGDTLATVLAAGLTYRRISKCGDHSVEASMGKTDNSSAHFLPAYPNASATENAFVRVINEQGTARVYG